ncbi:MAG: 2OG-Fe(II) oxygenase [Hyphomonadaceae bacterium]|nr:2OG-Fe(II) oxygenase [Hyphomonadaceae bacterium]
MSLDRQQYLSTFRQAIERISGQHGEPSLRDFQGTVSDLQKVAPFMPGAKAKLAVLTALGAGTDRDDQRANTLFMESAMGGLPPIVRELGVIVLSSGINDGIAATLLTRAVHGGDWIAGFLIVKEALRGRYLLDRDPLIAIASSFAETVPFKDEIDEAIKEIPKQFITVRPEEFDPIACQRALDKASPKAPKNIPGPTTDEPEVAVHDHVLSPLECDYLIAISCAAMQPSKVVSAKDAGSLQAGFRTSDGAVIFPHMLDLPTVRILQKLSSAAGIEPQFGEFLSLLRYRPGQEYKPHHDFLEVDDRDYSMIARCGQRSATLLTYLNDDYSGGETAFPALDFKYKGKTGSSVYFRNTDRNGKPIQKSLHAGCPIVQGQKWMATLWVREKPFWPWIRDD